MIKFKSQLLTLLFLTLFLNVYAAEEEGEYYFDPLSVKRDPFSPSANINTGTTDLLQLVELNQITLAAILTGTQASRAMLILPGGDSRIVKEGDKVGRLGGKIVEIKKNEVIVAETFVYNGKTKTTKTSLVLAQ